MENMYYTPSADEFCVGFQFQLKVGPDKWVNIITKPDQRITHQEKSLTWAEYCLANPQFMRVKIVNDEDFESLGFIFRSMINERNRAYKLEEKFNLIYRNEDNYLRLAKNEKSHTYSTTKNPIELDYKLVFQGTIKNKTELIKVLKQTGCYEGNSKVTTVN